MNDNSVLRKMALAAKKRLNGVSNEKEKSTKKQISTITAYKNLYKNDYQVVLLKNEDEELYEKVKKLLDNDYDNPNILKALVNESIYNSLENDKKMEYMLKLADKYNELKKRYIKENNTDLAM